MGWLGLGAQEGLGSISGSLLRASRDFREVLGTYYYHITTLRRNGGLRHSSSSIMVYRDWECKPLGFWILLPHKAAQMSLEDGYSFEILQQYTYLLLKFSLDFAQHSRRNYGS